MLLLTPDDRPARTELELLKIRLEEKPHPFRPRNTHKETAFGVSVYGSPDFVALFYPRIVSFFTSQVERIAVEAVPEHPRERYARVWLPEGLKLGTRRFSAYFVSVGEDGDMESEALALWSRQYQRRATEGQDAFLEFVDTEWKAVMRPAGADGLMGRGLEREERDEMRIAWEWMEEVLMRHGEGRRIKESAEVRIELLEETTRPPHLGIARP